MRYFVVPAVLFLVSCSSSNPVENWDDRIPLFRVIYEVLFKPVCQGGDLSAAEKVEISLGSCHLEGQIEPTDYYDCVDSITQNLDRISDPSCKLKYVPSVRETLLHNLRNHVQSLTLTEIQASSSISRSRPQAIFNHEQLDQLFQHVVFWRERTQESIYANEAYFNDIRSKEELDAPWEVADQDIHLFVADLVARGIAVPATRADVLVENELYLNRVSRISQIVGAADRNHVDLAVLVPLLEMAVQPLQSRIDFLASVSDAACNFIACGPGNTHGSDLYALFLAFSSLDQPTSEKVQETRHFVRQGISHPGALEFAERLLDTAEAHQGFLRHAFHSERCREREGQSWSRISDLPSECIPPFATGYVNLLKSLSMRASVYSASGKFFGKPRNELNFPLTRENLLDVKDRIQVRDQALRAAIDRFKEKGQEVISSLRDQNSLADRRNQVKTTYENERKQLAHFLHDLEGHQASLMSEAQRASEQLESSLRYFQSDRFRSNESQTFETSIPTQYAQIAGADAPRPVKAVSLTDITALGIKIPTNRGEVLTLSVAGRWSPHCALGLSPYAAMGKDPVISSEGYKIQSSSGTSHVTSTQRYVSERKFESHQTSHTESTVDDQRVSQSVSSGFSFGIGIFNVNFGGSQSSTSKGKVFTDSTTTTSGSETSSGKTDSTTDSVETRTSASFEMGMRLANTPFPALPAGSLLIVQVPRGESSFQRIVDVTVAKPHSSLVADSDSDFYFVVNDFLFDGCQANRSEKLSVEYSVQRPVGVEATRVMRKLQAAISEIRAQAANYLKMGEFSAVEKERLEKKIYADLAEAEGDIARYASIRRLAESWISYEMAQIDLRVRIQQLERRIEPLRNQVEQLKKTIQLLKKDHEFSDFRLNRIGENAHFSELRNEIERSISFLETRILPVVKLRFPEVFGTVQKNMPQLIGRIRLDQPILEIAEQLRLLLTQLGNVFPNQMNETQIKKDTLLISFPREFWSQETPHFKETDLLLPFASPATSFHVWNALHESTKALYYCVDDPTTPELRERCLKDSFGVMKIEPEDLYVQRAVIDKRTHHVLRPQVTSGSLPCNASAPIIHSLGVYFQTYSAIQDTEVEDLNLRSLVLTGEMISDSAFPTSTPEQVLRYSMRGDFNQIEVPVFFGRHPNPTKIVNLSDQEGAARGLSPFGHFRFNFRDLRLCDQCNADIFSKIEKIILVMRVEYVKAQQDLKYIDRCSQPKSFGQSLF